MRLLLRVSFAVLLLCSGFANAAGATAIDQVAARIARPELLRGRFEQDKQVAGFRKPLRSQGRFVLARGRGILWQTETPFASSLVVTPEQIAAEAGGSTQRIDAAQEPALRTINAILFDLIGGDVVRLQSGFDVVATVRDGGRWQLQLRPRPGLIAQAFIAIELEGAAHVDRVVLDERNGDRTEIVFRELADAPALSTEEDARLAQ